MAFGISSFNNDSDSQQIRVYRFPQSDDDFVPGINATIVLTCLEDKINPEQFSASFPAPPSISTGGQGTYGSIELGMFEGLGDSAATKAASALGNAGGENLAKEARMAFGEMLKTAATGSGKAISAKIGGALQSSETVKAGMMKAKIVLNQNTQTTFESNQIRSFSYTFKVIPKTSQESAQIQSFAQKCLERIYAPEDNGGLTLRYPPEWKINFMVNGNPNICFSRNKDPDSG
jgi:hypothetical protein